MMKPDKAKFRHAEVARAFNAIGQLAAAGKLQDALGLCQQIDSIEPDNPHILNRTGYIQLKLGLTEQAAESFRRSIERAANLPSGYVGIADYHLSLNEVPETIDHLTSVPRQVARTAEIQRKLDEQGTLLVIPKTGRPKNRTN